MSSDEVRKTPAHDALLGSAYEVLVSHDGDMSKVKMQDVVKRAGLTSGAFYNVWPGGLPAFQKSLLSYALAAEHISYLKQLLADLGGVSPEVMPISEVARHFGAADSAHLLRDPGFRVQVALWARHGSDPAVATALQASYQELAGLYVQIYDRLIEAYGREWREPFDSRSFATILTALAEGLALRAAVDPSSVPSNLREEAVPNESAWDLFGLTTALLIESFTQLASDPSKSAWASIRDLDRSSTGGS